MSDKVLDIVNVRWIISGVVSDRERTLPAWGPGPTRSFMSNAHDQSRPVRSVSFFSFLKDFTRELMCQIETCVFYSLSYLGEKNLIAVS